jgi:hypothetical protein
MLILLPIAALGYLIMSLVKWRKNRTGRTRLPDSPSDSPQLVRGSLHQIEHRHNAETQAQVDELQGELKELRQMNEQLQTTIMNQEGEIESKVADSVKMALAVELKRTEANILSVAQSQAAIQQQLWKQKFDAEAQFHQLRQLKRDTQEAKQYLDISSSTADSAVESLLSCSCYFLLQ